MVDDSVSRPGVPADALRDLVQAILVRSGVTQHDAAIGAAAVVQADVWGVSTHGSALLPAYVRRLRSGLINPSPSIVVAAGGPWTRVVDGDNGLGHVVASKTMDWTIESARANGIAAASVRSSNHFGAAGVYAVRAATAGMIGIVASNGAPVMAPWGAARPYLSTNPLAVAVGNRELGLVVLDMASSAVSRSLVSRLAEDGEPLPPGVALDSDGLTTQDAVAALGGALLPTAAAKGSALALVIEILCGVLSAGAVASEVRELHDDLSGPQGTSHFFLALDISAFGDAAGFADRLGHLADTIRQLPPAEGFTRVIVPGDEKVDHERAALRDGVVLPVPAREALVRLARQLDIPIGSQLAGLAAKSPPEGAAER